MATRPRKRNKNEPTCGDKLHQNWRNRQAMFRVYESAISKKRGQIAYNYWTPVDIRTMNM